MDTTSTEPASVLDRVAAMRAKRAEDKAKAVEAAEIAVAEKYEELQAKNAQDLLVLGDAGGMFRGVFRPPAPEVWKRWKAEFRSEQQRAVANQNLAVGCMLWPTPDVLASHAVERPALYDALGVALQVAAGAGEEALIRK